MPGSSIHLGAPGLDFSFFLGLLSPHFILVSRTINDVIFFSSTRVYSRMYYKPVILSAISVTLNLLCTTSH